MYERARVMQTVATCDGSSLLATPTSTSKWQKKNERRRKNKIAEKMELKFVNSHLKRMILVNARDAMWMLCCCIAATMTAVGHWIQIITIRTYTLLACPMSIITSQFEFLCDFATRSVSLTHTHTCIGQL